MIFRNILVGSLVLLSSDLVFAGLTDHISLVRGACPTLSPLLVKKSALELNSPSACAAKYTAQILLTCKTIDCHGLFKSYKKNIQGRSGSVVGE